MLMLFSEENTFRNIQFDQQHIDQRYYSQIAANSQQ